MQTFLPLPDVEKSLVCLDYRRLGKQRVETKQLIKSMVLEDPSLLQHLHADAVRRLVDNGSIHDLVGGIKGWVNHPAREMWRGHIGALAIYHDCSIIAWKARGYKNNMPFLSAPGKHKMPVWFGDEEFHASHRSNLLRKDPIWYGKFGWQEPTDLEYIWPSREERFQR
jgi:hypothetical protein